MPSEGYGHREGGFTSTIGRLNARRNGKRDKNQKELLELPNRLSFPEIKVFGAQGKVRARSISEG